MNKLVLYRITFELRWYSDSEYHQREARLWCESSSQAEMYGRAQMDSYGTWGWCRNLRVEEVER